MKKALQHALVAKQVQREKAVKKTVAEKLAIVERLRDRKALIRGRSGATRGSKVVR